MKKFLFPLLLGLTGVVVLVSLGVWQLQRLEWKEGLLADIEAKIAAEPVELPAEADPETDAFLAVTVKGAIGGDFVPVFGTWRGAGAGYRIIVPFDTGNRQVLVDLGVARDAAPGLPNERLEIVGNLNWPDETEKAPDAEIWTKIDVPELARRLDTEALLVVAREVRGAASVLQPVPVGTEGIPNSHLGYAIQWFGLALVWAGMTAFLLWRMHVRTDEREA